MARKSGNVKWFSNEKGYGFIEQEDGDDVFVHHSDIQGDGYKTLKQGEVVEYEIISADKGPKAQDVVRTEADEGTEADEDGSGSGGRSEPEGRQTSGNGSPPGERDRGREPDADSSLARQLREKLSERFLGGS